MTTAKYINRHDGTTALLRAAALFLCVGLVSLLLTLFVLGGVNRHGPHTNGGWLGLLAAMLCLPLGGMLFALGAAKWLRNRRTRL